MKGRLSPVSGASRAFRYGAMGLGIPVFLLGMSSSAGLFTEVGGLLLLSPIGGLVGAGYGIARYLRFEYELTDEEVVVRSGVFARRKREIPYRRIQSVDVRRDVVKQLLGLAVLRIETAGGSGSEVTLNAVSATTADELRETIARRRGEPRGRRRRGESTGEPGEDAPGEGDDGGAAGEGEARSEPSGSEPAGETGGRAGDATLLHALTPAETVVASVASFRWGFLLLVPGVLFGYADLAVDLFRIVYGPLGIEPPQATVESLRSVPPGKVLALLALAIPGWVGGAYLASVAYSLNRYWNFTLGRAGEDLRYRTGLLTERGGTVPMGKVQLATIRENVLLRALGKARVSLRTAGGAGQGNSDGGDVTVTPLADRPFALELARGVVGDFGAPDLERPPKRARSRYLRRYLVAGGVVLAALAAWGASLPVLGAVGAAVLLLAPPAAHLKWRHRGYYLGEDHLVTRRGFWRRQTRIVPYRRIQTVATSRTVFQRRYGLATVVADAAGGGRGAGDPVADDRDEGTADELHDTLEARLREAVGSD